MDEYIKINFQQKLDAEEYKEFLADIRLKYKDEKNPIYKDYIEVDMIFDLILNKHRSIVEKKKAQLSVLFNSMDYEELGYISVSEWALIFRWVEPEKFETQYVFFTKILENPWNYFTNSLT